MRRIFIPSFILVAVGLGFFGFADAITFSNVRAENFYFPGAQVKWDTDVSGDSAVMYGLSSGSHPNTLSGDCMGTMPSTAHCVNFSSLTADTTYYYKVVTNGVYSGEYAFCSGSNSNAGYNTACSGGGGGGGGGGGSNYPPSAPSGLLASVASNGIDVVLTWTDNSSDENEFKIYWRPQGGDWSYLTTNTYNQTSYTYTNHPTGTYEYHVNACNSYGCSGDSNTASVTVSAPVTIPSAPSNLRAEPSPGVSTIYLAWNDNSSNEDKFNVEREVSGSGTWTLLYQQSANGTTYADATVVSGTYYSYRVQACLSGAGCSAYTQLYNISTSGSPSNYPSTPTNLSATVISSSQINISWTPSTDDVGVTGYSIHRNGAFLASVSSASYSDTGLTAGAGYNYIVQAYDVQGNQSAWSSIAYATTTSAVPGTGDTTAPVISNLRAENIIGSGAQILWDTDDSSNSYVKYGTTPGSYPLTSTNRCDAGGYVTSHCINLTDLAANTTYYYKAESTNSSALWVGSIEKTFLSASVSATTTAGNIPLAPSSLRLEPVPSASAIYLKWNDNSSNEDKFNVEREISGSGSWTTLLQTGANAMSHTDSSVIVGTIYNYRVQACLSGYGCSAYSYLMNVSTSGGTTGTTSTTTVDIFPPYVSGFGNFTESDGRLGAGVDFSEPVDPNTITDSNIYIILASDGSKVPGYVTKYPGSNGVDYRTSLPAQSGVNYRLVVKKNVKDLAGNQMLSDYTSVDFQKGSVTGPGTAATFAVDAFGSYPKNGDTNVSVNTKIWVNLTKAYDPASTVSQFFNLAPSANPLAIVSGSFSMYSSGFEFIPSVPLQANTSYSYKVLTSLKDTSGNPLASEFQATFTTASGGTAEDATLEAKVEDASGNPIAKAYVSVYKDDSSFWRSGETDAKGLIGASVPAGNYTVEVYPPTTRTDLSRPQPIKVSVLGGEKKSATFVLKSAVKIITGVVTFSDLRAVTDAEVGAYSHLSGQWTGGFSDANGKYTLKVGPGKWTVGLRPKDPLIAKWSYSGSFEEVAFLDDSIIETKTVNFIVASANSTLAVTTIDEVGSPLADAGVVVDTISSLQTSYEVRPPPEYRKSDSNGRAIFLLPGRTYYVRGFMPPEKGFLNSQEQEVVLPSAEKKEIRLVFKRKTAASFMVLTGSVRLEDGTAVPDAFIWAWSERGGYTETRSNSKGAYELSLTSGERWRVGAGKTIDGIPYKSSETSIDAGTVASTLDIALRKLQEEPLPAAVTISKPATEQVIAQTSDGARMTLPASSAASSGTVNVEIQPTIEAPTQAAAKVVSTVYEVTVKDAAGKEITKFSKDAEISIPYDENVLKDQGVSEESVIPSFFDETTKTWVKVDDYTIDKENNVVIVRVNHLTRFAIVAAADITPPLAPSGVSASALGGGVVKISWTNPARDFDHAKVYRSEKSGALGQVIAADVSGKEFSDSTVKDGVLYYYIIRAVDPAGNESTNTGQTSVMAKGTYMKPVVAVKTEEKKIPPGQVAKLNLLRDLTVGSEGEDVKALQQILLDEGVYPHGLITGFFGELTKRAVIRFQEKYADEILKPAGLLSGTGYVGPGTRKKINSLSGVPSAGKPEIPPGQKVKLEILKDLSQGTTSEEVKALQQLLLDEGVYPEGLITGFFGELTKQAVIRFQEKYASEILIPVGLDAGTGYVGPATRKKVNELLK